MLSTQRTSPTSESDYDAVLLGHGIPSKTQKIGTDSLFPVKQETPVLTHTLREQTQSEKSSVFENTDWIRRRKSPLTIVRSEPPTQQASPYLVSEVKATVHGVDEGQVRLRCELPNGKIMTIRVPSVIVPEESLRYGAPVTVSKSTDRGYLRLRITPRQVSHDADPDKEIEELEAWVNC